MRALSNGYGPSNCTAAADLTADAVAVVDCTQNTLAGGPTAARYILYGKPLNLANHFTAIIGDDAIFPCAPNEPAPQTWHYNATPDVDRRAGVVRDLQGHTGTRLDEREQTPDGVGAGDRHQRDVPWWLANG